MKEISRTKKLEVAQCYTLGLSYREIEDKTGVSHGSIVTIVKELESGKLDMPSTPFDQVNDLRQLSSDLKKKGLSTSQALLGVSLFERLRGLGTGPEQVSKWLDLVNRFASAGLPVKDLFESAARLHQLERDEGKSFEFLAEEYVNIEGKTQKLRTEIDSLVQEGQKLSEAVHSLTSQALDLRETTQELQNSKVTLMIELEDLQSQTKEAKEEGTRLKKEVEESRRRLVKLPSEVDGKETSLIRLNDIGFRDEDLLRLRAIIERIPKDTGAGENEVKERFFTALGNFKDITELQNCQATETVILKDLTNKTSLLTGEIAGLEKQRDILRGDTKESATSAVQQITDAGQNAVTQLQQQAESMKGQLDSLFAQALKVAGVIGDMKAMVKKGEDSGKTLNSFIEEVTDKLGTPLMENADFNEAVSALEREFVLIESRARELSARFQALRTKTELLKVDILRCGLAKRTKSLARQAGFKSMGRDGKNLGVGLGAAVAGLVLGGVLTGDGLSATVAGISGFNGALQELGKSRWAVSLDPDLLVVPRHKIVPGRTWVTMESLVIALEELREKARTGEQLGNIDTVVGKLKDRHSKLVHLLPVSQWVAIPQNRGTSG